MQPEIGELGDLGNQKLVTLKINKREILIILLDPFHAAGLFLYHLKTSVFLMCSGGIERSQ